MIQDIIQYSRDSWGLLPLLVVIFIIGLTVIIERYFFFAKSIRSGLSLEYDLRQVAKGNVDDARKVATHYDTTVQGELVKSALQHKGQPEAVFERDVEETIMFQLPKLDRNLWLLDTCVTLGPLLGLLGTIVHLVEAFAVLAQSNGQNVSSVTGPIAHALVATAVGLVVAIVCVVFLNYFNKRIRLLINQMDLIKSMLVTRFAVIAA
ncbi:MotA/TolQ/ExbB proton channel family protein [Eleftheria terrae]|uniref:MotA/TolQ/ExbB proton channel family protein n=1 Tax=Eleftheria terrae TaxID=1597781 RepID=UPI00263AF31A|nr:MotA/TolQ/ExbB proton channel family protein [Eleftheria terrae]WKB52186.1 MotA/TolQ/ExbB proton channel family protein [Eleftheria terrae]